MIGSRRVALIGLSRLEIVASVLERSGPFWTLLRAVHAGEVGNYGTWLVIGITSLALAVVVQFG